MRKLNKVISSRLRGYCLTTRRINHQPVGWTEGAVCDALAGPIAEAHYETIEFNVWGDRWMDGP